MLGALGTDETHVVRVDVAGAHVDVSLGYLAAIEFRPVSVVTDDRDVEDPSSKRAE